MPGSRTIQEAPNEQWDVFPALPQRRQPQSDDIEPVEQILAKAFTFDFRGPGCDA
jgi:hypothetical protein